jgi:hypothetical protein
MFEAPTPVRFIWERWWALKLRRAMTKAAAPYIHPHLSGLSSGLFAQGRLFSLDAEQTLFLAGGWRW